MRRARLPAGPLPTLLALALAGPLSACSDVADRDVVSLDAAGLDTLVVRGVDGSLVVRGKEGLEEVEAVVRLKAWESEDDVDTGLDDTGEPWPAEDEGSLGPGLDIEEQFVVLLTDEGGGTAALTILSGLDMSEYYVRARVKVPADMAVVASQIEGDITLRDVGGADVLDGTGGVDIRRVQGPVEISDDGGPVRVQSVEGEVGIVDAGGRIVVKDVIGDVEIRDGKGAIKVRRVSGKVTVWDTQGSQSIKDVGETELHDEAD